MGGQDSPASDDPGRQGDAVSLSKRAKATEVRAYEGTLARGADEERERVVSYLRGWEDGPGFGYPDGMCDVLKTVADAIKRGEHMTPQRQDAKEK